MASKFDLHTTTSTDRVAQKGSKVHVPLRLDVGTKEHRLRYSFNELTSYTVISPFSTLLWFNRKIHPSSDFILLKFQLDCMLIITTF